MRAASPPRQIERENEMIVISHRLFLWTIRAGRDSHALHRHFEQSKKSFSFAVKRCICEERKTGNPSSRTPRAKPVFNDAQPHEAAPPHRHFEQSEKSFSFAAKRCICEERKTGNPSSGNLRANPAIMTLSLMKLSPHTVISSRARNLFRMW